MIIESNKISSIDLSNYDVLIIGSGLVAYACGSAITKRKKGIRLLFIEAGSGQHVFPVGKEMTGGSSIINNRSLNSNIGGNSLVWGGLLSTFDRKDFLSNCRGKFHSFEELESCYQEASEIFGWPNHQRFGQSCEHGVCKRKFVAPAEITRISQSFFNAENIDLLINSRVDYVEDNSSSSTLHFFDGRSMTVKSPVVLACNAVENARIILKYPGMPDVVPYSNHIKGGALDFHSETVNKSALNELIGYIKDGEKQFLSITPCEDKDKGRVIFRVEPIAPWTDNHLLRVFLSYCLGSRYFVRFLNYFSKGRKLVASSSTEYDFDFLRSNKIYLKDLYTFFLYFLNRFGLRKAFISTFRIRFFYEPLASEGRLKLNNKGSCYVELDFEKMNDKIKSKVEILVNTEWFRGVFGRSVTVLDKGVNIESTDTSHHFGTTADITSSESRVGGSQIYIAGSSELSRLSCINPTYLSVSHGLRIGRLLAKKVQ